MTAAVDDVLLRREAAVESAPASRRWRPSLPRRVGRNAREVTRVSRGAPLPALSPGLQIARVMAVMVVVLCTTMLLQLYVISHFQQRTSQQQAFDEFRSQLAIGTAPIGPNDSDGNLLRVGAPVALLEMPTIDVEQVVVEGTTSGVLLDGPGHRRDTVLPGQEGISILLGRRASFGGPFARITSLAPGDAITVTTGQGVFQYQVIGVRREGDPVPPPPAATGSRLVLVTASGRAMVPSGVVRVDADLQGEAVVGAPRLVSASGLPSAEQIMAGDTGTLWALALWLQALAVLSIGAVWAWHRWGRARAWVVGLPPLLLVGLGAAGEVIRVLPNLL